MNRIQGFAGLAGLLGLGAMAAGLADPWPESLRAIASLAVLLALPAYLLSGVTASLAGASGKDSALRLSLAFLVWLCVLALWTTALATAGMAFRDYAVSTTWALLAMFAVCGGVAWRRRVRLAPPIARGAWILVVACALFAAVYPPQLGVGEDGLDHVGYVRRMLTDNTLRPAGVLALPAGETHAWPDPRKGALHPVVALASWISSTDPLVIWRWLAALMFPAAALAVLAFTGAFLGSRGARMAASVLVLFTFFGNPFRFAGASPHGESIAAMWCWVLTALAITTASQRIRWPVWILLSAGGVLVHLGVALHVLVLAATVGWLGGTWGIDRRGRIARCVPLAAGVAVALWLRRADFAGGTNLIHSHTQGVLFLWKQWFVASPLEILRLHGMLFLGGLACVPLLIFIARRRDARLILAASAIPFAISFVPWLATWFYERGSYMVFRSLLQVPGFAAIVVGATALAAGVRTRRPRALLLGLPVAAAWMMVFLRPVPAALVRDVRSVSQPGPRGEFAGVSPALIRTVAGLPSGSVVLTDPATSYVLSAHTSQRFVTVYQQHGNPRDPFALERIQAVRDVLSPYVLPDAAVAACRRFGVNYVVVNGSPPHDDSQFLSVWRAQTYPVTLQRMASFGAAFTRVASLEDASVYRFDPRATLGRAWSAQDQPVTTGSPVLGACDVEAPGGVFRITGLSVAPSRVLPGDTVQVTLGYHRDAPSSFRLPVLVHLRFDHEVLDQGREFPGEKQWRRLADGRSGVRSRFREDLRPGHGVYEPDLWPVGFDLCETFSVVVPPAARMGDYRVEVSIAQETHVPNFRLRDLFFNRDHYSGTRCASLSVADRVTTRGAGP